MAGDWTLFGYGSLTWRPGFEFKSSRVAVLSGWERRFWQGSEDHRGVPGDPGRVVTLVARGAGRCLGRIFRIDATRVDEIRAQLDLREQGGYARRSAELRSPRDGSSLGTADFYIATPSNPHWLGPASVPALARQIAGCRGPSGTNREYLSRLHAWLADQGELDEHTRSLFEAVEALGPPGGTKS